MATDSVKVAVRVRPFNQRETSSNSPCIISMSGNSTTITNPSNGDSKTFSYDHSYWSHDEFIENESGINVPDSSTSHYASQEKVFSELGQGVLDNSFEGYNAALFAYGQTGSGKSYSMIGYKANKGIVPITCEHLFRAIDKNTDTTKQFQVTFSMLEIYNEQVRDLLAPVKSPQQKGGLRVRQHPKIGFYVEGLKQIPVQTYNEIERLMDQGAKIRSTASTNMNATSSRSHMVITIKFKQIFLNEVGKSTTKSSEINLVDLAGSERAAATGATGDRLKEGSAINQSLSTLGNVISALADVSTRKSKVKVPYRDSVLTKLLMTALGGNSRTIMIAALSPAAINYDETLSTLRYADRAKRIQNKATINESATDKLVRDLKDENTKLKEELEKLARGGHGDKAADLQKVLEENERQMQELEQTWNERLEVARLDWERNMASVRADATWQRVPFLQNVNEDPQLSGVIKLCFQQDTTVIGKAVNDIVTLELRGLGILSKHAVVKKHEGKITIEPGDPEARILVNGKDMRSKAVLKHLDRIKFGSNSLYLYVGPKEERNEDDHMEKYDYDFFQTEMAEQAGINSSMFKSMGTNQPDVLDYVTLQVFHAYINLLSKISEANAMSEELGKGVRFEPEIKNLATHDARGKETIKEIIVRVKNNRSKKVWVWSEEKFINRKFLMEDMYQRWCSGENTQVDDAEDPFWDPLEDIYLGCCHVWLQSMAYCIDTDEHLVVRNHRGKEEASLHVKMAPCDSKGEVLTDDLIVMDPSELLNKKISFMVMVSQATGVQWVREDTSRGVYFQFKFFDYSNLLKSKTVLNSINPKFKFKKQFTIDRITEEFLDYLQTHALVIEMWGTQVGTDKTNVLPLLIVGDTHAKAPSADAQVRDLMAKIQEQEIELSRLRRQKEGMRRENTDLRVNVGQNRSTKHPYPGVTVAREASPNITIKAAQGSTKIKSPRVSFSEGTRGSTHRLSVPSATVGPQRRSSMVLSPTVFDFSRPDVLSPIPPLCRQDVFSPIPPLCRQDVLSPIAPNLPSTSSSSLTSNNTITHSTPRPASRSSSRARHKERKARDSSTNLEIAKALKLFFKDVRGVQGAIREIKHLGDSQNTTDNNNTYVHQEKLQAKVVEVEKSLENCLDALKESVVNVIRKKRETDTANLQSP